MKKLFAWVLLLAMCVAIFAGCTPTEENPSSSSSSVATKEDLLADAKSMLYNMYKDKGGKTMRDFKRVAAIVIGDYTYDVTWTTDAAEENVKIGEAVDGIVVIDVNEGYAEEADLTFKMVATLTADGKTETVEFEHYIPGKPASTGGPAWIEAPAAGTTAKFALTQGNLGKVLYFTGKMAGNYFATSANPAEAVDVTIEEVEGGVRFYFMDGEIKMYIDINEYQEGKAGVRLTAEPTAVFVWNEECKVYAAEVAGAYRYLGTYNTYNTISASDIKYIAGDNVANIGVSQFTAAFCNVNFKMTTFEGQPAAGTTAKFFLTQGNLGKNLYFTGKMAGNYLATSTNPFDGVDVTIEEVEGGYRFYFMDGETKMYIDINEYQEGKAGVRLTAEPTAVFVWNEECKVFAAEVAGAYRYLGTYNTYNTISASDIKYIAGDNVANIGVSQFTATFGNVAFNFDVAEGQPAVGTAYHFALVQGNLGKALFFTGKMAGNYLATSANSMDAVEVFIEEVEGGYRFYFMEGETKMYIDINEYQEGKAGVRLTAEPTAVFVWNEECKVFAAEVAGAFRYLGTYNTYNTISASDIKYIAGDNVANIGISQFPAGFGFGAPAI